MTKNSLVKRLFFISLPFTLLAGVLYAAVIIYIESQSLKATQLAQVKTQVQQLAKVVAIPTWNLDQQFINNYLTQYAQDPHILCIELMSDANFTENSPENCQHPESADVELFSEPIIFENQYIGVVVASFRVELDNDRLKFILLSRIPTALVALLSIFIVVFLVFRRWVVTPIESIMKSIEASQEDGKHHPVDWSSNDEIGTLVETFNEAQQQQVQHDEMLTSERDKAEQALVELKHAQSQLVESEKMASLGSLVAGISHEINTPLGVARTSASYVEDSLKQLETGFYEGTLTKNELKVFIDTFNDGIRLMTANLVRASDLMTSFKQVSADQSYDEDRDFNLNDYLQETLYTLKPNLKRYQVAIILDCEPDIIIHSLPGALSQVFTNLIMNSLIHAYEPSDNGNIRIQVKQLKEDIEITYSDDGKGMSDDVRKKIFDPFFTTKRGNGGTGLGMHIIYNIVSHKLQGTIDVNSTLGEGSQFIITLPKKVSTDKLEQN
ncbi:MAG: HAMP domain-containing histidine kinase [Bermanella sp.]